ncbi:MAG TPA: hypothetical protein VLK36_08600 [Gaiellaceae bacterium]|nr:hypothetical protein [Gaiellaceae bacterium]
MARRDAAAVRPRGGESISTARRLRTRLITALGSLAALAAAGADAIAHAGEFGDLAGAAVVLALALLAFGILARYASTIPWSIVLVGAAYLIGREGNSVVDGGAAIIGALLLLSAELASWSIGENPRIKAEPSLVVRRVLTIGALVLGALVVDVLLLGTAAFSGSSGILLVVAGVAAAVAAMALVLRLVRG